MRVFGRQDDGDGDLVDLGAVGSQGMGGYDSTRSRIFHELEVLDDG